MAKILCKFSKTFNNQKRISDNFCIYSSNDFDNMPASVAKANRSGNAVVKVIGKCLPRLSDWTIEFTGEWKQSQKYGYTFFADSYNLLSPSSLKGIIKFLSSKSFPGIGEKTATAIVKEFKNETLDVIENTPELLLRVSGLNLDKIGIISDAYKKNVAFSQLCSYLASFAISSNVASRIYDKYNEKAIEEIKNNPYCIRDIRGVGFQTCEKIARVENVALDSYLRIESASIETIKLFCETTGNMFMLFDEFEKKTMELLNQGYNPIPVDLNKFRDALKTICQKQKIFCRNKNFMFLEEYEKAEDNVARTLSSLTTKKIDTSIEVLTSTMEKVETKSKLVLSAKQKQAIIKSLSSRVSIITGGPGTGKTTIEKVIIGTYKALNSDAEVTLLAPTGKAARRMSEATGYKASTIHSRLKLSEYHSEPEKIEDGLVIVDEASMIDNLLMEKLCKALNSNCQLIIVGDIDQLPSVGSGAVLAEMIDSASIPTSKLTEIFRQEEGSSIIDNAVTINSGSDELIYNEFFQLVDAKDEKDAVATIKRLYSEEVARFGIDNVALLSPLKRTQNRFTCVSDELNKILQDTVNKSNVLSVHLNNNDYRIGDRVLQWKNTEVTANGDIGEITDIAQNDDGIMVKINWENGQETLEDAESMESISLAYSMSIHKSQGSEYDCVIIPLLSVHKCQLFKRNLLYTGVTRAKKKVILVNDNKNVISDMVNNSETNKRNTLLALRIKTYVDKVSKTA